MYTVVTGETIQSKKGREVVSNGSTELWYKWHKGEMVLDDLLAELIRMNQGMLTSISTKYKYTYKHIKYDLEEWKSLATYGLYKAVLDFDPSKQYKLTTFMYTCIHKELNAEQGKFKYEKYQDAPYEFVNVDGFDSSDHHEYFVDSDYTTCPERHLLITDALKRAGDLLGEPSYIQLRFKGYTNYEIARLLGKGESTVGNRISRFQNKLRKEQVLGEVI